MIEALFEIVIVIVEVIVSAITALIESIVSLFAVTGEVLTAGEAISALFWLIAEIIGWLILLVIELTVALFTFRKPRKVVRPNFRKKDNKTRNKDV